MTISIICPLCENTDLLPVTLEAMFHLDDPDYEIIFAAEPTAQEAIIVAQTLCDRYPIVPSRIITTPATYCINPKLNNLQKGWLIAAGDWILLADCNVLLPHDAIQRLQQRWSSTTGMVCSPPIGSQPANFAAEVECSFLNQFQAKWQILADFFNYGFVQGKMMFCEKTLIDALGGLAVLDAAPCEDAAATKLVRSAGLHVRLVRPLFEQPLGKRSLKQVWHRQLRWAKLRRVTFPLPYAMEIFVTPIPFLLSILFMPLGWPLTVFVMFYGAEIGLALLAGWYVSWRSPVAMVMRDLMMTGIWLAGWFGSEFSWAGQTLALNPAVD